MLALLAAFALLFSPAYAPPPETCAAIHTLVGGELVEWIGYPQGWNLPDDLTRADRVDFADGGVWEFYSASEQARYVWVFVSYEVSGTPRGAHEFCGPYRLTDA